MKMLLRVPLAVFVAALMIEHPRCSADEQEEGFESLFNGETLDGWNGDPALWRVENGAITGTSTDENPLAHNQFLIWDGEVGDFVLRLQFRIADRGAGNSGIQYRAKRYPDAGEWVVGGYQADIERTNKYMGILYEERGRGILALCGEKVLLTEAPSGFSKKVVGKVGEVDEILQDVEPGEWHEYEITARGNHLVHKINGRTTVSVEDEDAAHAAERGILAFQLHAGPAMQIQFRDIRLKPLTNENQ